MPSISLKELRDEMPFVRRQLKNGASFLVIYKNQPIAKLTPVNVQLEEEASDEDVETAALNDINHITDDDDYLSPEELKYYLSLKEK